MLNFKGSICNYRHKGTAVLGSVKCYDLITEYLHYRLFLIRSVCNSLLLLLYPI